jgi:hypothetical protein
MRLSDVDGQIAYDLEEFCNDYGPVESFTLKSPAMQLRMSMQASSAPFVRTKWSSNSTLKTLPAHVR